MFRWFILKIIMIIICCVCLLTETAGCVQAVAADFKVVGSVEWLVFGIRQHLAKVHDLQESDRREAAYHDIKGVDVSRWAFAEENNFN